MNGRIYDPLTGRMLSADLLVQFPGSLQSYNRYSYVANNPLTFTDPSGFEISEEERKRQNKQDEVNAQGTAAADSIIAKVHGGHEGQTAAAAATMSADNAQPNATPAAKSPDSASRRSAPDNSVKPNSSPAQEKAKDGADGKKDAPNSIAGAFNSPTSRPVDTTQPADVLTRVNGTLTSTGGTGGSIDRTWTVANPSKSGYIMQHVVRNGVEYWEVWPITVANGVASYSASQNDTVTFSDVSRTMVTASQKVQLEAVWLPGYVLDPKDNWQPGGVYGSADLLSVDHAPVGWPPSGPMIQDSGSMHMTVTHQPFVPDQTLPRTVTLQFTGQTPVIVQLSPRG